MNDVQAVTKLLVDWSNGNNKALDNLMPLVYDELQRIARRFLNYERPDHTLDTSALVHEAYLNLIDQRRVSWQNKAHFFALASQSMRRILINHARKRRAVKRGGGQRNISLDEQVVSVDEQNDRLLALDESLTRLETFDPRLARIVEYRYFGGLTIEETAAVLSLSPATIKREWQTAKAWLYRDMKQGE